MASQRLLVEECYALRLNDLRRTGVLHAREGQTYDVRFSTVDGETLLLVRCRPLLAGNACLPEALRLTFISTSAARLQTVDVRIVLTTAHLGGYRKWFACPCCRRRVAILYIPPGGAAFACRTCYRLIYFSARKHDARVDALIRGGSAAIAAAFEGSLTARGLALKAYQRIETGRLRKLWRFLECA